MFSLFNIKPLCVRVAASIKSPSAQSQALIGGRWRGARGGGGASTDGRGSSCGDVFSPGCGRTDTRHL